MKIIKTIIKQILITTLLLIKFSLFAENYNIETATIEEDRIEAEVRPEIANKIADKWYNKGAKELARVFDTIYFQYDLDYDLEDSENVSVKWYDRGEKDIALEFDRIEIESDPFEADYIADQWYKRGEKEIALEFDGLAIENAPLLAIIIADKWYERGEKEIALKFDGLAIENAPLLATIIADKWYERGEKEIALEFDKLYLEYAMQNNYFVSNIGEKWYDRGEKEIALEFDKLFVRYASQKNWDFQRIADQWYKWGEKEIALEFDRLSIESYPSLAMDIANKWVERGIDIAAGFEKSYPNLALIALNRLIKSGNFAEAEEYGNKMLEYWISQSDEDIRKDINNKLNFAINAESDYYYHLLKNKLINKVKGNVYHNYSKFFENVPLNPNGKDISITEYLSHRTCINPDFLTKFNITIEEARKMLEIDLYELTKKSDITFSVLHAIAIHAKGDPHFKLNIFYENPVDETYTGIYRGADLLRVDINSAPLRSKLMRKLISHEWTHQLMAILFHFDANPYLREDNKAKDEWEQIMKLIWKQMDEAPDNLKYSTDFNLNSDSYERMLSSFNDIKRYYGQFQYDSEAIARFAETIAQDGFEDPKVKEFLQPIYDYWMKYIEPAIHQYVLDHASIDTFVSDWERENILDPFYRAEVDSDEYKNDLRICKGQPRIAQSISNKWSNRGDKEHTLEFDKVLLENNPNIADTIADKWYECFGEKEIAIEFDTAYLANRPHMAYRIANKWYNRGEKEFALEFDKAFSATKPYMSYYIADKWYNRGEKEFAIEFDTAHLAISLEDVEHISSKWKERGYPEIAQEFENLGRIHSVTQKEPKSSEFETIADKWYKRGEKEIAIELDTAHLAKSSEEVEKIVSKWKERGYKVAEYSGVIYAIWQE